MHGDRARVVAHTVKQERLQIRRDAKSAKRERKDRQKEIKKDLTAILEGWFPHPVCTLSEHSNIIFDYQKTKEIYSQAASSSFLR